MAGEDEAGDARPVEGADGLDGEQWLLARRQPAGDDDVGTERRWTARTRSNARGSTSIGAFTSALSRTRVAAISLLTMIELARSSARSRNRTPAACSRSASIRRVGVGEMGVVQPLPITRAEPILDVAHGPFAANRPDAPDPRRHRREWPRAARRGRRG